VCQYVADNNRALFNVISGTFMPIIEKKCVCKCVIACLDSCALFVEKISYFDTLMDGRDSILVHLF